MFKCLQATPRGVPESRERPILIHLVLALGEFDLSDVAEVAFKVKIAMIESNAEGEDVQNLCTIEVN